MSLLSEVIFASALVYSPRGQSPESQKSRDQVRDPLKRGDADFLRAVSEHLRPLIPDDLLAEFFAGRVLVPTPRRAPLPSKDALWPSLQLCEALKRGGMGTDVLPCLVRTAAVPKSAFAGPGERPVPQQHYDTFRVDRKLLDAPRMITVVDDFITKGATLLAAVSRVKAAFPGADVRAFALVRTMGFVSDIEAIDTPCRGQIRFDGSKVDRQP